MDRLIFRPLRLSDSNFSQPLDIRRVPFAARAAGPDGSALEGGWRVNPELAAGGLWTTPSDVARLAIAVVRSSRAEPHSILGPTAARELLTRVSANWGLGVDLGPSDGPKRFGHSGHTVGFSSNFVIYPDTCQGAVVMTNADQGGGLVSEVLRAIGDSYGWPGRKPQEVHPTIPLTTAIEARFVGNYRLRDFPAERFSITRRASGLYWARAGHVGRDLLPESELILFSPDSRMTLEVVEQTATRALTLSLSFGGGKNVAERISELPAPTEAEGAGSPLPARFPR
jgi:CubicO group peptidase (beta-lactamase class C family)